MDSKLRVLVADDHWDIRQAIILLLSLEFDVIGVVPDGRSLMCTAVDLRPDVIVSDISMPFFTGPQVMNELRFQGYNIPFVLISGVISGVQELVLQGAEAVVDKHDMSELPQAIRSAAARQISISRAARSSAARGRHDHWV